MRWLRASVTLIGVACASVTPALGFRGEEPLTPPAVLSDPDIHREYPEQLAALELHQLPGGDVPLLPGLKLTIADFPSLREFEGGPYAVRQPWGTDGAPVPTVEGHFSRLTWERGDRLPRLPLIQHGFRPKSGTGPGLRVDVVVAQRSSRDAFATFLDLHKVYASGYGPARFDAGSVGDGASWVLISDAGDWSRPRISELNFVRGNFMLMIHADAHSSASPGPDMDAVIEAFVREVDAKILAGPRFASIADAGMSPRITRFAIQGLEAQEVGLVEQHGLVTEATDPGGEPIEIAVDVVGRESNDTASCFQELTTGAWRFQADREPGEIVLRCRAINARGLEAIQTLRVTVQDR